jgi:hypothetical protein
MYSSALSHDNYKFRRHVNNIKYYILESYHHTRWCKNSQVIYKIYYLRFWKYFCPPFLKSMYEISSC